MTKEGGYTVVEAGLAMAISASLILLTAGLTTMVGRQRFRDSLSTAQAFIQAQYNEVRSGINSRLGGSNAVATALGCQNSGSSATANSKNCYTIGRLVTFPVGTATSGSSIQSSYIIAKVASGETWPNTELSAIENLKKTTMYALTGNNNDSGLNPTVKNLGNSSSFKAMWYINGSSASRISDVNSQNLAIFRSPTDGSLVVMSQVKLTSSSVSGVKTININSAKTNMTADQKIALGITNGGLGFNGGLICIPGGDSSAGITNNFNSSVNWNNLNGSASNVVTDCKNWDM